MSDVTKTSAETAARGPGPAVLRACRRALRGFFLPTLNRWFLLRLTVVGVVSCLFFGYICIPARIHGRSMEPTYHDGGFTFCWRPRFWRRVPQPGDVVMIRLAGRRLMYLKRVVAGSGATVEFRQGKLWVDGVPRAEPYVTWPCDWTLAPRVVPSGQLYAIGDNRTMPIEEHTFGSVPLSYIEGGPLW
jgi:signal peptidase I